MEGPSKFNIALKWGGIMAVLLIIVSLVMYLTGMVDMETGKSGILSNILNYVISIGAIVMAISEYKKAHNALSFGEGTVIGILTGIVGGLIMAIYTYLFFTLVAPDMLEVIQEQALAQTQEMSDEQMETTEKMMGFFVSPVFMSIMVVIMKFFLGLIIGMIAGGIMKEEAAPSFTDTEEV
jgi:small-conductance mechanosensitive channel